MANVQAALYERRLYCPANGRTSVPPCLAISMLFLRAHEGVSFVEAIERTKYDLGRKVALGLEMEEVPTQKSSLQAFAEVTQVNKGLKAAKQMLRRRDFLALSAATALGGRIALSHGTGARTERAKAKPLREKLAADPQRPRYHLLPPANWMNDPNGPIFFNGQCHMFYQYNPNGAFPESMHWGHAVSPDLMHWKHLPIALAPTPGGADKDGCWSGCAVVDRGVPTIVYTGVFPQVQCIASSDDGMMTWRKYPGNPVIAAPPQGMETTGFRDPCVWREADEWLLAVGSGIKDQGGMILLYRSRDLIHWDYLHLLCKGRKDELLPGKDPVSTGEMWECPDFFPLADKHALLVSTQGAVVHSVGTYVNHYFRPEVQGRADLGDCYYAARSMADEKGRRILWGWIREGRSEAAQRAAGWSGVMSLPRVLIVRDDGGLGMAPAPELAALRGKHHHFESLPIVPGSFSFLKSVRGDSLEIQAEFEPGASEAVGLTVRRALDGKEQTSITYNRTNGKLLVERDRSSLSPDVDRGPQGGAFALAGDETLKLHVFLDASVIEIFANDRACLTSRIYPSRSHSLGLGMFARGAKARLKALNVWEMRPISPNRLTRSSSDNLG
jgi:beta-fructofuranosidase